MADEQVKAPKSTGPVVPLQQPEVRRDANFVALYSNNILVESNAFDLKLVFGLTDLRNPIKPAVDQIASVNLSWPEVKLLMFWMQLHVDGYERENGKIRVPAAALPPETMPTLPPQFNTPQGREAVEHMRRAREAFVAKLSEP